MCLYSGAKHGMADRTSQFDYFFRRYPDYGEHQAGYAVTAGLGWLLDWIEATRITEDDLDALADSVLDLVVHRSRTSIVANPEDTRKVS